MANPGTLPITLVTILLLVAPGYLAIRLFLRRAERNYTLDRTEKVVWSSAVSLASLLLLYVFSPLIFGWLETSGRFLLNRIGFVSSQTLETLSLPTGILLYLTHLVVLFGGAEVLGARDKKEGDDDRDRREPWRYAFDDAGEGRIEVFLENGSQISGEFDPSAWDSSQKDLYIENPVKLSDNDNVPIGQSMLVRSEWITGVVFSGDDPNRGPMETANSSTEAEAELDRLQTSGEESDELPDESAPNRDDDPSE